jgi:cytidylate kinase
MLDADYDQVAADIARRDASDQSRADSPLVQPDGAVTVDTTGLDIDQVLEQIVTMVEQRS